MKLPAVLLRRWKELLAIALILGSVLAYLTIRARDVRGWDNWHFGSAQTMLTVRYWARDGMATHLFFFLPSGYYPGILFLDQPQFRFLADGTSTGQMIGNRVYYTHYPPGYIFPFGFLAMLGATDRFWFRFLAILLSMGSSVFLYAFLRRLLKGNAWAAGIGVFFYVTSTVFLGYADSLANQPLDDFFRLGILALSLYAATGVADAAKKKKLSWAIWLIYFLLCFSSYDATFLIFIWLCGLDLIQTRKLRLKTYFLWGLAPVAAFLLQIAQNLWYLGWHDMVLDFFGALKYRSTEIPIGIRYVPFGFKHLSAALSLIGYMTDLRTRFSLFVVVFLTWVVAWRFQILDRVQKEYVGVLFVAGMIFPFLMPVAGTFGYQGRLMAPFLLPLIGIGTYEIFVRCRAKQWKGLWMLVLPLSILWAAHVNATVRYLADPGQDYVSVAQYEDWTKFGAVTPKDSIILATAQSGIGGSERFFAQFYADRLIPHFADPAALAEYAPKIKAAVSSSTEIYLLIRPDQEEETRRVFAAQRIDPETVWRNERLILLRYGNRP